jgi:hypothetical protein
MTSVMMWSYGKNPIRVHVFVKEIYVAVGVVTQTKKPRIQKRADCLAISY